MSGAPLEGSAKKRPFDWVGAILGMIFGLVILSAVVVPMLWVYSTISTCGWKGLFVECRIMDCPK